MTKYYKDIKNGYVFSDKDQKILELNKHNKKVYIGIELGKSSHFLILNNNIFYVNETKPTIQTLMEYASHDVDGDCGLYFNGYHSSQLWTCIITWSFCEAKGVANYPEKAIMNALKNKENNCYFNKLKKHDHNL
jgi:hypothetical protein